jgi:hypothetical protein
MDPLAQFLRARDSRNGPGGVRPLVQAAWLQAWNATTYANAVSIGGLKPLANLPVLNPASLGATGSTGPVLLINTDGGPVVLGRIYRYSGA